MSRTFDSNVIWTIVPVKPFMRAKSRLASVLAPEARASLGRSFLEHTLATLAQVPQISRVLVVSRDPAALVLAASQGAVALPEAGTLGLNAALRHATRVAAKAGVGGVLILPADLPLLSAGDVEQMIETGGAGPVVNIAPDRHETGTNALFVRPPGILEYAFGEHSFARHRERAEHAGARLRVQRLPGAALDVDVPEDLRLYLAGIQV
jgi:2-phospho-L-lactate/phosphoenolpyruvate guanylyltransferase